jgi:uncharacterized protein
MTGREILRKLAGFARHPSQIHGPAHWARVQRFGALLAETEDLPPAARTCVEVFAQIHDLAREDDGGGNQHAIDGAFYMDEVVSAVFDGQLSHDQIETIRAAIRYHSDGTVAQQASEDGLFEGLEWPRDLLVRTVGCCWDADRIDLLRVGIYPAPEFMSTSGWRDVLALSSRIHGAIRLDDVRYKGAYDPTMAARRGTAGEHKP